MTAAVLNRAVPVPGPVSTTGGPADPLVKPTVALIGSLLDRLAPEWDASTIGVITFGDVSCRTTAWKVLQTYLGRGRVAPIEFVNANSGAPLSVACTTFGLRGPTLNLVIGGERIQGIAVTLAAAWVARGDASTVLLVEATRDRAGDTRLLGTAITASSADIHSIIPV